MLHPDPVGRVRSLPLVVDVGHGVHDVEGVRPGQGAEEPTEPVDELGMAEPRVEAAGRVEQVAPDESTMGVEHHLRERVRGGAPVPPPRVEIAGVAVHLHGAARIDDLALTDGVGIPGRGHRGVQPADRVRWQLVVAVEPDEPLPARLVDRGVAGERDASPVPGAVGDDRPFTGRPSGIVERAGHPLVGGPQSRVTGTVVPQHDLDRTGMVLPPHAADRPADQLGRHVVHRHDHRDVGARRPAVLTRRHRVAPPRSRTRCSRANSDAA